jgi:hypothetical protein
MSDTSELVITPDLGVIVPPEGMPHATLRERASAACRTLRILAEHGLDAEMLAPLPDDEKVVDNLMHAYAADEDTTNRTINTAKFSSLRPAVILQLDESLQEFSHAVVKNAVQVRQFVTNKLLLESSNPDPRVRIRALELLGKISDVGLFTERSEVTVTHRSTDDLKQSLREKLDALRSKALKGDAEDANVIDSDAPLVVDLDAELGELN